MKSFPPRLLALASTLLCLTGCATSGPRAPEPALASVPPDLRDCFDTLTERPAGTGALSAAQVAEVIAHLRQSELRLSACGKRLLAFYGAQAAVYGGR
ncbi:hypothetical protein J5J86_13870 [Aquabacter sp. L1I39]|uniref:hypothetical protein n=1 Tax=Aquabacter sp. L1I39 TaxID=2820278 RepID=UPI001ADBEA13|nr:hypothetical protein [Aquabacter sp. L1I39]QTL01893.1 hypothetical protein J5J86_13870 [Aquabacter sp. L1I39]